MPEEHIHPFLKVLKEHDPKFFESFTHVSKAAYGGALSERTRTLIWLAIDSVLGKDEGLKPSHEKQGI